MATSPISPPTIDGLPKGDAQAIIEALTDLAGAAMIEIPGGHMAAALPKGVALQSVKSLIDEYRTAPERRRGTAKVNDIGSFVGLVRRFADAHSVLFAVRDPQRPSLQAVLDYHEDGAAGAPRWGQHRVVYDFPISEQWRGWTAQDGEKQTQGEFAAWIEDRIVDVLPPPAGEDLTDARFPGIAQFAGLIGGSWASPQRLVELARGLAVHVASKVKDVRNLASGEAQIAFEAEHQDEAGAPLKIPSLFLIGIPVFSDGPAYRVAARLRYRAAGSGISWSFDLWRPELAFRHAIEEACAHAAGETGCLLIYGAPEA